ncbi:hypothetical protein TNCV_1521031 [Trichonephila clavipes]|nr:hypothetical protein TNCV_1521031 [Trichonephila clavipes]
MDFRFKCRNFRPAARTNYSRPNKEECTVRASGALFRCEWSTINSPAEIVEKFEEYERVRRTLRPKFYNSFAKARCEASGSSDTYFQRTEYPQGGTTVKDQVIMPWIVRSAPNVQKLITLQTLNPNLLTNLSRKN